MLHCCTELADNLGNHDIQPTPAYISQEDWDSGRRIAGWYPGAIGPGYYFIHEIGKTMAACGDIMVSDIEYRPMLACPYCGCKLPSC